MSVTTNRDQAIGKLNGLIESGRGNLAAAVQEMQTEFQTRRDIIVKPAALDFEINGGIHPIIGADRFDLTGFSEGQLLERAAMPRTFASKLQTLGETDLLRTNLRTLLPRVSGDGVLVRHVGALAKGILSSSYRRMDASPIFEGFVGAAMQNGFVPHRGLNTDRVYTASMLDTQIYEPRPGEFLVYGVQIKTSDYGAAALEFNLMMLRIVCNNLAVGMDLVRKVHLGRRFDGESFNGAQVIELSNKTHQLDTRTVRSAIQDAVKGSRGYIAALNEKVNEAAEKNVNLGVELAGLKKKGIKAEIVEKVKTMFNSEMPVEVLPAGHTAWRLSNVLSLLAQGEKGDSKLELEEAAFSAVA